MRRSLFALSAMLVCIALLSSCSLLPGTIIDDSGQQAEAKMQQVADAVRHHDASALKKLFSTYARENATDLDGGLRYFLSFFPSGRMTWKSQGMGSTELTDNGKHIVELLPSYKVSANGKEYELYFVDYSVNTAEPDTVGIYALGVEPYEVNGYTASGAKKPFDAWASSFGIKNDKAQGIPGVYVPQK